MAFLGDQVPPHSVIPVHFFSVTDPALDVNNHVAKGKMWIKTDNVTTPTWFEGYLRNPANDGWILLWTRGNFTAPAAGDVLYVNADGRMVALGIGAEGEVLTVTSGIPAWETAAAGGGTVDIEDEGAAEGAADTIDFVGAGVSVTFAAGKATVDIPGGGGSGLLASLPYAYDFTAPVDGDFSWLNQGAASVDTSLGGIRLTFPENTGNNVRGRVKAHPSTPYVLTTYVDGYLVGENFQDAGLLLRSSSGLGILLFCVAQSNGWQIRVSHWTDVNAFSSTLATTTMTERPRWLRITDNGTTRTFQFSFDGLFWFTLLSHGNTTAVTPNQIGFGGNDNNATHKMLAWLLSWAVT